MPIEVHLHGYLKAFHPEPIKLMVNNAAEAIEAISKQLKGFAPNPIRGKHRISVLGHNTIEKLYAKLDTTELHIVPQMTGGKNGGWVQIAIGVVLVAASFFMIPPFSGIAFNLGMALVIGGIMQLLSPAPTSDDTSNQSRYLGAPKNTVKIGTRIPILYGEHQVYGQILSFDIQSLNKAT